MGRTVSELSATMTVDELTDWFAVNKLCPIGDERMDYLFAHVCLRIFQAAGVKKPSAFNRARAPDPNDWQLSDFLMFNRKEPVVDSTTKPIDFMRARFGGRVVKKAA